MTKLSGKKKPVEKMIYFNIIKNPFYSKFYADSNEKKRFSFQQLYSKVTVTVTFIYILLFLAQNGEGTVQERSKIC